MAPTCAVLSVVWAMAPDTPASRATLAGILALAAWRLRRNRRFGVGWRVAGVAAAGPVAFALVWWLGHGALFRCAEAVRGWYPVLGETLMRAVPGNDPLPWSRLLLGAELREAWSWIYLGGWVTVPLLAMGWYAVRGRAGPLIQISWSHLVGTMLAVPVFLALPIPDPWYGVGWFDRAAPPWWEGIAQHVVTAAFPSLHVAISVAVLLAVWRAEPYRSARAFWLGWAVLLGLSTLALRTHWLLDLPAGVLFGILTDRATAWIARRSGALSAGGGTA